MTRSHLAGALLAFGSLAILPACSLTATHASNPSPVYVSSNPEVSPGMVRQVQTTLQQQGLYTGAIDGVWGPRTEAAVQSFQQSHALNPSGQLNSPTLAALNLPADSTAPMQPVAAAPAAPTTAAPDAVASAPPMPGVAATTTTTTAPVATAPVAIAPTP